MTPVFSRQQVVDMLAGFLRGFKLEALNTAAELDPNSDLIGRWLHALSRPFTDLPDDMKSLFRADAERLISVLLGDGGTTLSFISDGYGKVLRHPSQPLCYLFDNVHIDFKHEPSETGILGVTESSQIARD